MWDVLILSLVLMYWCWFEKGDKRTTTKPGTDEEQKLQLWHSHQSIQVQRQMQIQRQRQRQITVYPGANIMPMAKHTCTLCSDLESHFYNFIFRLDSHFCRTSSSSSTTTFLRIGQPVHVIRWQDLSWMLRNNAQSHYLRPAHWMISPLIAQNKIQLENAFCHLCLDQVGPLLWRNGRQLPPTWTHLKWRLCPIGNFGQWE